MTKLGSSDRNQNISKRGHVRVIGMCTGTFVEATLFAGFAFNFSKIF